tara:strand:- start:276 stop:647 length:372 start_codon:yes stop_codon:yes gene_type:complete
MNLKHFMSPDALKILFELNGWNLTKPFIRDEVAVFTPDFYPEGYVIGRGKYGQIYASGETKILFKDKEYSSVSILLEEYPFAVNNFDEWEFIIEKEWVISKKGEWLSSFSTLFELPKASKYRC